MRKYIDADGKKNDIRLSLTHPDYKGKVIVIVEGESDIKLFRNILSHDSVKFESMDGKQALLSVMRGLVVDFPENLFAICDADHDHLTNASEGIGEYSIYVTDEHDAEVMMLKSPSLDSFMNEHSSLENIDNIRQNLLNNAFRAAYPIGLLRWINTEEELKIRFEGLSYSRFIVIKEVVIELNAGSLIDELLKRSGNISANVTKEFLAAKLNEFRDRQACKLQVCSGHDLTKIISMVYRQSWASLDSNMNQRKVESALRLGFQRSFIRNTNLYNNLNVALKETGIELEVC